MSLRLVVMSGFVLLAACASPSQRISTKLIDYGVPEPQAVCMGDRLEQRLTTTQLVRLGEVARLSRDSAGRMTVNDLARALNRPGDEALVAEVLRSGLGCLI